MAVAAAEMVEIRENYVDLQNRYKRINEEHELNLIEFFPVRAIAQNLLKQSLQAIQTAQDDDAIAQAYAFLIAHGFQLHESIDRLKPKISRLQNNSFCLEKDLNKARQYLVIKIRQDQKVLKRLIEIRNKKWANKIFKGYVGGVIKTADHKLITYKKQRTWVSKSHKTVSAIFKSAGENLNLLKTMREDLEKQIICAALGCMDNPDLVGAIVEALKDADKESEAKKFQETIEWYAQRSAEEVALDSSDDDNPQMSLSR